jgi:site-specific DNA-methyltransferase (adenine-specific)
MPTPQKDTVYIKIAEIDASEKTREDPGDLISLRDSIKANGLLNPIIVDGATKKLITGWRRFEACKMLKLEEIKATLFESLTPLERRTVEIEEEIRHKKIRSWQEEVMLKRELNNLKFKEHENVKTGVRQKRAWSQEQTANLIGISRTSLSEDIRLAEALEHFPELLKVANKSDARRKMYRLRELALLQELSRRGKLDPLSNRAGLFHGDCIELLTKIKDNSVDLVITDPPWGIGFTELAGAGAEDYKQFDDNANSDEVRGLYKKVIPQLFRVLKEGCHLYIFFGIERYREILDILKDTGFDTREVPLIWVKDKPGFSAYEYKPTPQYEAFFFAVKNTKKTPRHLTESTSDIFNYPRGKDRIHITEKPIELLKRLVTLSSNEGDVVLDPFAGSGSTLVAAMISKRKGLGMEKDKETYEWALGRLKTVAMEEIEAAKDEKDEDENESENSKKTAAVR